VFTFENQKATSIKENNPTPSQAMKRNTMLVEFIIRSMEKINKPNNIENLPNSGSFLK
jgi:hypothetical protein